MCKLVIICVAMLGAVLVQVVTIVLYGRSVHIVEALPSKTIVEFAIGTVMITFVVITIQLFLSLLIQNQLIPMAVGMIGALTVSYTHLDVYKRQCLYLPTYV